MFADRYIFIWQLLVMRVVLFSWVHMYSERARVCAIESDEESGDERGRETILLLYSWANIYWVTFCFFLPYIIESHFDHRPLMKIRISR